jgi:ribonuclease-3
VLGLVVADHAFRMHPDLGEGWLSRTRATVVRSTALAEMAEEIGLGEAVLLGKGEDASGGRTKTSILADTLEAVIGAVFLDGGWDGARAVVLALLGTRLGQLSTPDHDHKSRLQELLARAGSGVPVYTVTESGPDHDKEFRAEVRVDGAVHGAGVGHSKKTAEQAAAAVACAALGDSGTPPPDLSEILDPEALPTHEGSHG